MNRSFIYISFILILLLGFTLPNLLQPHQGILFILEEVVGGTFLVLGTILFIRPVRKTIRKLNETHPWKEEMKKRLTKELSYVLMASMLVATLLYVPLVVYIKTMGVPKIYQEYIEKKHALDEAFLQQNESNFHPHERFRHRRADPSKPPLVPLAFFIFAGNFIFFGMLFGIEELLDWNDRMAVEKLQQQELLKEQALMKASVLKKQLNPHFMFNTLNVLSGLIHEDLDKSERFIKELSDIYRYILEQSEEIVSPLSKERDFIESYFYLLQIRFEEKLQYTIHIPDEKLDCTIPSMTLEVLVENAVKHNILDKTSPLKIDIYIEKDSLIVRNNLQQREEEVTSHGVGLSNLNKRLELLGITNASFQITGSNYIAAVPLLCD